MKTAERKHRDGHRLWQLPERVWEVLIFLTVTPALVHGVLALNDLPIV